MTIIFSTNRSPHQPLFRAGETGGTGLPPGPTKCQILEETGRTRYIVKLGPFGEIISQIRWQFRFWRGLTLSPLKAWHPLEVRKILFFEKKIVLWNWPLLEKIEGLIRWLFCFGRGYLYLGAPKGLVPPPSSLLNSFLQPCHYYVFWGADSKSGLKNIYFEKIARTRDLKKENALKLKKSKCENHIELGPKICEMWEDSKYGP